MKALFAGSFDPPTNGHLNLIQRASGLFDSLVVVVAVNPGKHATFSLEERLAFVEHMVKPFANVIVLSWEGMLADCARQLGAEVMIRGLRNAADFSAELELAGWNRELAPEIETIFLPAERSCSMISSSAVRELARFGRDTGPYVPAEVAAALRERLKPGRS